MKRLNGRIAIGDYFFNYVTNVEIESSWETYTDTCRIELPNKFKFKENTLIAGDTNLFKRGDDVIVILGYFPNEYETFRGKVSNIIPGSPFVVECQDAMWTLKQENIASKSWRSATIKDVIDYCMENVAGIEVDYDDETIQIGSFAIDNNSILSIVDVFDVLEKTYGFQIYVQFDRLQVMSLLLTNGRPLAETHTYRFQNNVIASGLVYQRDDDIGVYVQGESILADNTRILRYAFKEEEQTKVSSVKPSGEQRALKYYNLTASELEAAITRDLPSVIYIGYKGSFVTFGEPFTLHGDIANLIDSRYPERDGLYIIRKVTTRFGQDGYKQEIELYAKTA